MPQTWTPIIRPPKDGELVNQAITGRAIRALQERTDYLYQHIEEFSAQNGKLVIQGAGIDPEVDLGDWVYYDAQSEKYKKALAEGVYSSQKQRYDASDRAYAVGMCISKYGGLGSILMHGWIQSLQALGISPETMVQDAEVYSGGRFYLSRKTPGKMSATGGAPLVQLGFFGGDTAFVSPLQKDVFESHAHYKFSLSAKPAASQNTAQTGLMTVSGKQYVDYFHSSATPAEGAPETIVMSAKGNGTTVSADLGAEFRVEIYRTSADKMGVQIFVDDEVTPSLVDVDDPSSGTPYVPGLDDMDWPQYGEWADIPGTGLSVAFVNLATPGAGGLPEDIKSIAQDTSRFKFFYPNDTAGWTNANPYDGAYVAGTSFRYMREYDLALNSVWPPVPTESLTLDNNGFRLVSGEDFKCVPQDLLWIPNGITGSAAYGPWPFDYPGSAPEYAKRIDAFFSRANISTARPIVLSLQSASSAILVRDCFTRQPGNAGNLELDLRLDLNTLDGSAATKCLASIDPATQKFVTSPVVSGLVAGSGITLSAESGRITVSADAMQRSGEVSIVSLKNAKESLHGGVTPCVLFLDPSAAKCQAVAKIKIPDSAPSGQFSLSVKSAVFGSKSVGGSSNAVFKAVYFVLRPGTNLNSFIDANAFATQVWAIGFSGYSAYTVLPALSPGVDDIIADTGLAGATISTGNINIGGVNGPGNLAPGDTVLMVLERIASYGSFAEDTYSDAEVGLTNITWQIA